MNGNKNVTQKVTMSTIAEEMGVSRNTVFKALKGRPGISQALREQILEKANELHYMVRNAVKEKNIVILVRRELFLDQTYFAKIFVGIEENLENDCKMVFTIIDNDATNFDLSKYINIEETSGIIIAGRVDTIVVQKIAEQKIPFVTIDHCDESYPSDCVIMMNQKGIRDTISMLVKNGHQEIGFIGNLDMYCSFRERFDTYLIEMKRQGLPINPKNIYTAGDIPFWDLRHLKRVFDPITHFPTAFICVNDRTAITVIKYFTERGIAVPHQLSIVGFDNTDESKMCVPSLTTIDVPKSYMGKKALELLLWRMQNLQDPILRVEVGVQLKERKSVCDLTQLKIR